MADYDGILTISGGRTKRANSGDTVNVTSDMNIKAVLKFEGATDDAYETTLAVTDPTENRTIVLPNKSGNVLLDSQDIDLADNKKIKLGNHGDLQIFHDGTNSIIKDIAHSGGATIKYLAGTQTFQNKDANKTMAVFNANGAIDLHHNGTKKFETTASGIEIHGTIGITNSGSTYTFPTSDGNANQVLQTNGSGVLSFATISSGGIASVSEDTDPSLGGDLEVGANKIHSSSGNVKIETGTGGGYIDITTTTSSDGNIYLRPQSGGGSGDGNVGIGNGFTPGSSKPTFTLQVKDDNNTTFVSKIENANTGTDTSCIELVLNPSTTNVDTTNKFLSFKKGTTEKGYLAGDGSGGLQLSSVSHLDIKSAANINIKSNGSVKIAEFDTTTGKFLFGAAAVSEGSGQDHFKIKEEAFSTSGGDPGLLVVHNVHNNHSTRILTLKGGNQSSSKPSSNTRYIDIFSGDNTVVGALVGDGSGGIQLTNSFTGSHPTIIESSEVISLGFIVESTGIIWANNQESISTAIPKVTLTNTNNSKKVFGVISSTSSDYEGYVAAWGVGESESQITVNSIGEGKVWVTNINGNIENGDYVTTSEISGHGRLQDDDLLHNYTVAKCTEAVDWSSVSTTINHNGVDYKKYLIGCTYHCG